MAFSREPANPLAVTIGNGCGSQRGVTIPAPLLLALAFADEDAIIFSAGGGDLETDKSMEEEAATTALARSLYDTLLISGDALTVLLSPDHADATVTAAEVDFTTEVDGGCCHAPIVKLPTAPALFDGFENWSSFSMKFVVPFA